MYKKKSSRDKFNYKDIYINKVKLERDRDLLSL